MNKQEAIEKIKNIGTFKINDTVSHQQFDMVDKNKVLGVISQINEPKKVVVPQFVADWYEDDKYDFEYSLYKLCIDYNKRVLQDDLHEWFGMDIDKPIETLVKMKLFGYEVEKEKRYTAKLKLTDEYLVYYASIKDLHHAKTTDNAAKRQKVFHFTEDDLVKYHIWGNDNYEVKEVEE